MSLVRNWYFVLSTPRRSAGTLHDLPLLIDPGQLVQFVSCSGATLDYVWCGATLLYDRTTQKSRIPADQRTYYLHHGLFWFNFVVQPEEDNV